MSLYLQRTCNFCPPCGTIIVDPEVPPEWPIYQPMFSFRSGWFKFFAFPPYNDNQSERQAGWKAEGLTITDDADPAFSAQANWELDSMLGCLVGDDPTGYYGQFNYFPTADTNYQSPPLPNATDVTYTGGAWLGDTRKRAGLLTSPWSDSSWVAETLDALSDAKENFQGNANSGWFWPCVGNVNKFKGYWVKVGPSLWVPQKSFYPSASKPTAQWSAVAAYGNDSPGPSSPWMSKLNGWPAVCAWYFDWREHEGQGSWGWPHTFRHRMICDAQFFNPIFGGWSSPIFIHQYTLPEQSQFDECLVGVAFTTEAVQVLRKGDYVGVFMIIPSGEGRTLRIRSTGYLVATTSQNQPW